jgi:hypothetical protein
VFREICQDVLGSEIGEPDQRRLKRNETQALIERLITSEAQPLLTGVEPVEALS